MMHVYHNKLAVYQTTNLIFEKKSVCASNNSAHEQKWEMSQKATFYSVTHNWGATIDRKTLSLSWEQLNKPARCLQRTKGARPSLT